MSEAQSSSAGSEREAFEALLRWLDPDPLRAGELYESLRRRLLRLYEWRGADLADELVDETLDRVGRRLSQGEEIQTSDPHRYASGVARRVFHELIRREKRKRRALQRDRWPLPPKSTAAEKEELEQRLECLARALNQLGPKSRKMILSYYQGERSEKIANRRNLAAELEIPLNALRIRAYRVRARLEEDVRDCLKRFGGKEHF